ncbi:MAG: DUF2914 domain-containing protein [Candidatus Margulisiibacteriota bacterium]
MSKITGYARQDEPTWLYISLALLALGVIAALLYGGSAFYRWVESGSAARLKAAETKPAEIKVAQPAVEVKAAVGPAGALGGVTVERITFTSELDEDNQPSDDLSELSTADTNTLYCSTRIKSDKAQAVRHVWLRPDGKIAADITLHLGTQTVDTYSYISLYGAQKGDWQMQVRNERDEVVAGKTFKIS